MQNQMPQAIEISQKEAIASAAAKLGRELTDVERGSIQRLGSLMMLESVCRSFAAPNYTAAQVLSDLKQFSK
jgi:hypothetical protein